ncbi:MAG: glycosyltransferase [Rhodothermales bacterium]
MPDASQNPDVLFCLTGDIRRNSRAIRQLRVLSENGLRVKAIGFADGESAETLASGVEAVHFAKPSGGGPRWFRDVHRIVRRHVLSSPARLFHASDLFVLPALAAAARRFDAALSFDSRELYPHVGATAGKPWASAFWKVIERMYITKADVVFTVNDSIADLLARAYSIDRPLVVPNIPNKRAFRRSSNLRNWIGAKDHELIFLLQGYLKPGRGCKIAIRATAKVADARLIFVGDGALQPDLVRLANQLDIGNRVHFHPFVPPDQLVEVTSSADIGLCLIEPLTKSLELALPNKLFEYLAARLPVLGSDLPEIARVIREFDVGLVCTPAADDVAAGMCDIMSKRARIDEWSDNTDRVFETFSPEKASDAFFKGILQALASNYVL